MVILLDTHFVLWSLSGNKRISKVVSELLADPDQVVKVSLASVWEMAIKHSIGKLRLEGDLRDTLENIRTLGFDLLSIEKEHILALSSIPHHHRDPFDRMLIAQAQHEGMHLLTADPQFKLYDVPLVDL
jgi:PIN domain nuclease of toxin-antitoxin system